VFYAFFQKLTQRSPVHFKHGVVFRAIEEGHVTTTTIHLPIQFVDEQLRSVQQPAPFRAVPVSRAYLLRRGCANVPSHVGRCHLAREYALIAHDGFVRARFFWDPRSMTSRRLGASVVREEKEEKKKTNASHDDNDDNNSRKTL
tara:strand:+ start:255 stop:686 length:432 start_codon:yes stop_codon:yes gene_type:complete